MRDVAKRMFRLTKTGQPVMGSTAELYAADGEPIEVKCVGKLYGRGGNADLIGIIVEYTDDEGGRDMFAWPLQLTQSRQDQHDQKDHQQDTDHEPDAIAEVRHGRMIAHGD